MSEPECKDTITPGAYLKGILHACRHQTRPVFGVLLGKRNPHNGAVEVLDCVPAFHSNPLASVLEICFMQIEEFARARDLIVLGIYSGNELDESSSDESGVNVTLTSWPMMIGEKIAEQSTSNSSIVLMVDNQALGNNSFAFKSFTYRSKSWYDSKIVLKPSSSPSASSKDASLSDSCSAETFSALLAAIRDGLEQHVIDFEQHLQAIRCDWRNVKLDADLVKLVSKSSA